MLFHVFVAHHLDSSLCSLNQGHFLILLGLQIFRIEQLIFRVVKVAANTEINLQSLLKNSQEFQGGGYEQFKEASHYLQGK